MYGSTPPPPGGLAQSVESFTAKRDVEGSIPGTGQIFMVLKWLKNEVTYTAFALQMARLRVARIAT